MALSAERHVHILTTDHILIVFTGRAERIAGVLLAKLADRGEFLDLLALGDQSQDAGEGAAEERTLQARDHDYFTTVREHLRKLDYVGKKLALIYSNNIKRFPLVAKLRQSIDRHGRLLLA